MLPATNTGSRLQHSRRSCANDRTCMRTQLTKPSTNRNPGPSRPWITQELLSAIKDKHERYHTYLTDKSNSNWQQFTTIRKKVTALLRNAKSVFVQSAVTDATNNAHLQLIMKCLKQKTATPIPISITPPPPPHTHTHMR